MRAVYRHWRRCAGPASQAPGAIERRVLCAIAPDDSYVVRVERVGSAAPRFVYETMGTRLRTRLGKDVRDGVVTADELGASLVSLQQAWQRCLDGRPHFDFARMRLPERRLLVMQRLLLPLADAGGQVTHLFGIALFDDITVAPARPQEQSHG